MRKLGLIGGMSWVSTRAYYERINKLVQKRAAPSSSAPLLIESLDYAPLYAIADEAGWDRAADLISDAAQRLEGAGAQGLLMCSNAKHRVYDRLVERVSVPVIHIADCVAEKMGASEVKSAALLGTREVMTESFYRQRLVAHGVDLLPPDPDDVAMVDGIISKELMLGKVTRDAERALKTIITRKEQAGADAIVLACTELELVVDTDANVLPVFDSTDIHCQAAADWILEG